VPQSFIRHWAVAMITIQQRFNRSNESTDRKNLTTDGVTPVAIHTRLGIDEVYSSDMGFNRFEASIAMVNQHPSLAMQHGRCASELPQ